MKNLIFFRVNFFLSFCLVWRFLGDWAAWNFSRTTFYFSYCLCFSSFSSLALSVICRRSWAVVYECWSAVACFVHFNFFEMLKRERVKKTTRTSKKENRCCFQVFYCLSSRYHIAEELLNCWILARLSCHW